MKKLMIAFAALAMVSAAYAGLGVAWSTGGGWGESSQDSNVGILDQNDVLWQLIYAGANNVKDIPALTNPNFLSGDDQLLAVRTLAANGGESWSTAPEDDTVWDVWLMPQAGLIVYQDLEWDSTVNTGSYVYQRVFEGTIVSGTFTLNGGEKYWETELFRFNPNYAGGGYPADSFYTHIFQPNRTIPEPATMSLLGLGALAMVLRRKLRK